MIADHIWRPPHGASRRGADGPLVDRRCEFMNCRRPRVEHERSTHLKGQR